MESTFNIIKLEKNHLSQFSALIELLNEVFEDSNRIASKKQLQQLLLKPDFHAIAAIENDRVIGGLTAYELAQYYTDKSELYIYDIAVKTELHNQGIGKALITFLKDYSIKNGIEAIFVQALAEEEQAVKFYESTFGQGEIVNQFNHDINSSKHLSS